jgi:sigma-B regulation protein RsbU (phosphoserine phosphatase)
VALVHDPAAHTLAVVNAGHPSPLVRRHASGEVEEAAPEEVIGPAIGLVDDFAYATRVVELRPGDGVVVFSDGLTEAAGAGGRLFQVGGIREVLREPRPSHGATGAALVQAAARHSAGAGQGDDIAILVFGRVPG